MTTGRMQPCPTGPLGRTTCAQTLLDFSAAQGVDVHVTTLAPLVPSDHEPGQFRCPHGVDYWIAPTGEQLATWIRQATS